MRIEFSEKSGDLLSLKIRVLSVELRQCFKARTALLRGMAALRAHGNLNRQGSKERKRHFFQTSKELDKTAKLFLEMILFRAKA